MSDEDFEKEMEDIAAGGFPDAGGNGLDDDDFLKSFPGEDDDEPNFGDIEEEDLFDAFPEEDDEDEQEEKTPVDQTSDDDQEKDEGFGWDEDDDPEGDPEFMGSDGFNEDEDEEAGFHEDGEEYEDEYEEYEDGESTGLDKGKLFFWGATGAAALAMLGAGYAVLMPMFFDDSAAPVRQPTTISQVPDFNPSNTPRQPPAIPNSENGKVTAPSLPMASDNRIQVPGHPSNVDTSAIRPDISGNEIKLPGVPSLPVAGEFQPGVAIEGAPGFQPSVAFEEVESNDPPISMPMPTTIASKGSGMDEVMGKLDSVLSRLGDIEEKFVTKGDVETLVEAAVIKATANLNIEGVEVDTSNLARVEDIEGLQINMKTLVDRINALEGSAPSSPSVADNDVIEAKVAERVAEVEKTVSDQLLQMGQTLAEYEKKINYIKAKSGNSVSDQGNTSGAETAKKLKKKLDQQKRELTALKAKGRGYVPQRKPTVIKGYRLAGLSKDQAWIETPSGVQRFSPGQTIRGVGKIEDFRAMDGNFAVITNNGIIIP